MSLKNFFMRTKMNNMGLECRKALIAFCGLNDRRYRKIRLNDLYDNQ